jgi:hypothetical protein
MRHAFSRRPSPAMVVACIALAVALGPASYAAVSKVARNSVGTRELKNNAVNSSKVRDFTLRSWDFMRGDLPRGERGLTGPQGPAGPFGPAGPQGVPGVVGDLTLRENSISIPGNAAGNGLYVTRAVQVNCQSGERVISGGSSWSSDQNEEELITIYSRPLIVDGKAVGWRARGGSDVASDRLFNVQALCAK